MGKKGRPQKKPIKPGDRVPLGLRVTASLKHSLDTAAKHSGRSQSQEAEFRLEHSFANEARLLEALDLAYGRELAGIMYAVGEVMRAAGNTAAALSGITTTNRTPEWWDDPYAFAQASMAAEFVLNSLRPRGDPSPSPAFAGLAAGIDIGETVANVGVATAKGLLLEIASNAPPNTTAIERGPRLRRALGQIAKRVTS